MGDWCTVHGRDILLPDGTPWFPFEVSLGHIWTDSPVTDAGYLKVTIGATGQRIECHFWEKSAVASWEMRDDSHPETGYLSPTLLAKLDNFIARANGVGLRTHLAIHSKCGRNGIDPDDPGLAPYCGEVATYPFGRNFWSDPTQVPYWTAACVGLSTRYAGNPLVWLIEPLNEPDPNDIAGNPVPDAQVKSLLLQVVDAIHAANPNILIMLGGTNGYNANKIESVIDVTRQYLIYTWDWFDQPGNGADPAPIPDREASLDARFVQPMHARATYGVPVFPQQFGSHYGVDTGRDILKYQLDKLLANKVPCGQWELHTPADSTKPGYLSGYGWISPAVPPDTGYVIRQPDELYMQQTAAGFAALTGTSLNPGATPSPSQRAIFF